MYSADRVLAIEKAIMPYLAAAQALALWLVRNEQDAQDVVQDACLHAFVSFDSAASPNHRAWFLSIVRNGAFSLLARGRLRQTDSADGASDNADGLLERVTALRSETPESSLLRAAQGMRLEAALRALPVDFREAFVLRETNGLTYKEIAILLNIPIGTVMSRLWRARQQLKRHLVTDRRIEG